MREERTGAGAVCVTVTTEGEMCRSRGLTCNIRHVRQYKVPRFTSNGEVSQTLPCDLQAQSQLTPPDLSQIFKLQSKLWSYPWVKGHPGSSWDIHEAQKEIFNI